MKKLALSIMLLSMAFLVSAQQKVLIPRMEVAAGANFSTIGGSDSWNSLLPGGQFGVGFFIDPGKTGHILYQGEASYTMAGSKYEETSYNLKGKVVLSYIAIPLMMQHRSESGFFVEGGVQPAFLVSSKDKYNDQTDDYKDHTSGFDFGIPVGIGFVFMNMVGINLRYTHGFSNINKEGSDKDHNRVFAFRVFFLPIKK